MGRLDKRLRQANRFRNSRLFSLFWRTSAFDHSFGGTTTTYSGHTTNSYMALDGTRSWTYSNDGLPYTLSVVPETEMSDTTEIVTLEYSIDDPAQLLGSVAGLQILGI